MSDVETEKIKEELDKDLLYIVKKLKERLKEEKRYAYQNWKISIFPDKSAIFTYYDGREGLSFIINVFRKAGRTRYEAIIIYDNYEHRIRDKKEYDAWINKKPIEVREHDDTIISIRWFAETPPIIIEPSEEEKKEIEKWLKLPPGEEREKLYEERIQFIQEPTFKEINITINTSDLDYLARLLRNYRVLIDLALSTTSPFIT